MSLLWLSMILRLSFSLRYYVTYVFLSESTLYSCRNVKELVARSRWEIWSLSDCNWTRNNNHLVWEQTLNYFAKLTVMIELCCKYFYVRCIWLYVLSCHARVSEWIQTLQLPECQRNPCSKQTWNLKFKWLQLESNP